MLCLWALYREKYRSAFFCLGMAFAFKLQAFFLLPFVITLYFWKKKFSILYFAEAILVFWCSGIAAYLNGRPLLDAFAIYANQTTSYEHLYLNICSFWMLFGNDYENFKTFAILLTVFLCGLGLFTVLSGKKKLETREDFFTAAAWFVWTCIFFLPAMHERYAYLLDILMILLAFLDRKYIKYAVVCCVMSFMAYPAFLICQNGVEERDSLIMFFAWAHFTYTILGRNKETMLERTIPMS